MAHYPIRHSEVPIRLFKSDFLEFFSHTHPVTIVVIWLPVAAYFLMASMLTATAWWIILGGLIAGLFLWTFAEYNLHRFVFHFRPRSPKQEKIVFLFHGVHHAQPQCKTRLVMPLVVSIPLAVIFWGIFYVIFVSALGKPEWIGPVFSGFILGYLIYDLMHYATHHFPMRTGVLKFLKRHHMLHHYKTPDQRYGVSSPLWDIIYGTMR